MRRFFPLVFEVNSLCLCFCKPLFQILDLVIDTKEFIHNRMVVSDPLLALSVSCEDLLLALNKIAGRYRFVRHIVIKRKLSSCSLFLLRNPANGQTLVVVRLLVKLQLRQLILHTDDLQHDVGLLLIVRIHKLREIKCQCFDELIEQLLAGLVSLRIYDVEITVLPGSGNKKPVR